SIILSLSPPEAELAPEKEPSPGEATALETLLRGEGLLEKKKDIIKEDETLLEIQRVLEADENGDGFHDDEDFEVDTPKRKQRKGRGRGSSRRRTEAATNDDVDKPYVCDNRNKQKHNSKTADSGIWICARPLFSAWLLSNDETRD
ncbi:zinc finger protein DPF3-like, partial [Salvelinus sp. IW2-2015]|uniref:zinc finger protein DPF3-like n=1 Tax=Salvelinus sp. IW2-2015 TaxID=2691554 RepID=UPI0038D3ACB4